jgi:hypothetical protein
MSLFQQLRRLYRPEKFQFEDFHTEIVAQVLKNSEALTLAWLGSIRATRLDKADHIKVRTQETFPPLAHHLTASRPDITIRLVSDAKAELIFVESKQGSTLGLDQLQRYAEHLHAAQQDEGLHNVALVFITRDYEVAESPLLADLQFQLNFQRTRWFEFYPHLKAHLNGDGLAKELKLFMEENRMSLGNQFRSTDVVALENFRSAKALMNETLIGEVSVAAGSILGKVIVKKALDELNYNGRYIIYSQFDNWNLECLIGYWFPNENPDEPVSVGVILGCNPSTDTGRKAIEAFRSWTKKPDCSWASEKVNDQDWSELRNLKSIQTFMAQANHVRAIKTHLLQLLEEVREFKTAFPHLPWLDQ